MFSLIGGIALEGLKFFNEKQRVKIMDDYHDVINALRRAENASGIGYTDIDIDISEERLKDFLVAYHNELKKVA